MDPSENLATVAADDDLRKAMVAAEGSLFAALSGMNTAPSDHFLLDLHEHFSWNDGNRDYEALHASSTGWHQDENRYEPFAKYFLGILLKACDEFENRVEHLKYRKMSKPDRIKAVINRKLGMITKKEILEHCPDISQVTVERTLTNLVNSGYIQKIGAGPSTAYVKTGEIQ